MDAKDCREQMLSDEREGAVVLAAGLSAFLDTYGLHGAKRIMKCLTVLPAIHETFSALCAVWLMGVGDPHSPVSFEVSSKVRGVSDAVREYIEQNLAPQEGDSFH